MAYVLVWGFEVAQNHREEFERAYGPSGQWRDLFASAGGYLGSELLRAPTDGRYLTIDRWESKARFDDFMLAQGYAYEGLDVKLQGLTRTERQIGEFDTVEQ